MASGAPTKKDFDDMRARLTSVEQDNELLMDLLTNISKVFSSFMKPQNDILAPFPLGDSKKLNAIVRRIEKCDPINSAQFALIEKYADVSVYAEAELLRERITTAFCTAYFRIHKGVIARTFAYDDVKPLVQRISEMEDKIDIQSFIKGLNISA